MQEFAPRATSGTVQMLLNNKWWFTCMMYTKSWTNQYIRYIPKLHKLLEISWNGLRFIPGTFRECYALSSLPLCSTDNSEDCFSMLHFSVRSSDTHSLLQPHPNPLTKCLPDGKLRKYSTYFHRVSCKTFFNLFRSDGK